MSTSIRRLTTASAVAVVLAAMLGTGLYAAFAPAAAAAGPWLALAVVAAALVALLNSSSVADLAAARPGSEVLPTDLPHPAARLAGIARLVARGAAAAAAAGVFGAYVLPSQPLPVAVVAVLVVVGLNATGVRISVGASRALVAGSLVVLVLVMIVGIFPAAERPSSAVESAAAAGTAAEPAVATLQAAPVVGPLGVLTATAFVFVAFTGVSRAAELGGSLRDPLHTVRTSSAVAVLLAGVIFLGVTGALLNGLGPERLAESSTPLASLIDNGGSPALGVLVRIGAAVATASALLGVLSRASRTGSTMAQAGDLPRWIGRTGPRGTPWVADLLGGAATVLVTVLVGPVTALAVSACALLVYYALLHASVLYLERRTRRATAVASVGIVACTALAVTLPIWAVVATVSLLVAGWLASAWSAHLRRRAGSEPVETDGPDEQAA
ncbi:APC family permease [Pseudonocardia endophytica]|uniref:Amino acid/polyamine/organocation transporter (APC superfamily) n=1 Tax=Pseudonocardia endophytica TaxID=401976 RepID=A0A4R1HHZ7_PSEEN|nr:APC family permease [Pseudonocardia endophytica]TCK21857.1 amino acid/polyamine/organocation transporter (APC superfamily) [Pseudonocardia endophytica]